jgi:transcriptional regulator with XRE-family HTH domain
LPDGGVGENTISQRLTQLRKAREGLTQARLAQELGAVAGTVGGWESGKVPELDMLVRLADYYGVELRWLVTGEGPREKVTPEDAVLRLQAVERVLQSDPIQLRIEAELRRTIPEFERRIAEFEQTLKADQDPPISDEHPEGGGAGSGQPKGPRGGTSRSAGG